MECQHCHAKHDRYAPDGRFAMMKAVVHKTDNDGYEYKKEKEFMICLECGRISET